ncbi:hypothetical protein ES703_109991 [subsurface metagenome]
MGGEPVDIVFGIFSVLSIYRPPIKLDIILGIKLMIPVLIIDIKGHLFNKAIEPDLAEVNPIHCNAVIGKIGSS